MSDVVDLALDEDDEVQITDVVIRNGSVLDTGHYEVRVEEAAADDDDVQVEGFSFAMDPLDAADIEGGEADVQAVKSEEDMTIEEWSYEDHENKYTEVKRNHETDVSLDWGASWSLPTPKTPPNASRNSEKAGPSAMIPSGQSITPSTSAAKPGALPEVERQKNQSTDFG